MAEEGLQQVTDWARKVDRKGISEWELLYEEEWLPLRVFVTRTPEMEVSFDAVIKRLRLAVETPGFSELDMLTATTQEFQQYRKWLLTKEEERQEVRKARQHRQRLDARVILGKVRPVSALPISPILIELMEGCSI